MFDEIVVIEYITNINALTTDQLKEIKKNLINESFLDECPNGTIIGKPVSGTGNLQSRVYYPFFSHARFPIKAGERAWAFNQGSGLVSYWITRKVQSGSAEDVNFTHFDREKHYKRVKKESGARESVTKVFLDSNSSAVDLTKTRRNAISRSEFSGEPVVSVKSRSIDLTLQGSNGTAIKLSSDGGAGTGTIDIVAGPATNVQQTTIQNSERYLETLKPILKSDSNSLTAGDLSSSDESRITVSRSFNADSYYELTGDDSGSQSSISIKSDGVRIVARNDLKIVVGEGSDPSSIIMKSNGDIIITPSTAGVIKLGGEDATSAILTQSGATNAAGTVTALPIATTSGDALGTAGQGFFATKVLIK